MWQVGVISLMKKFPSFIAQFFRMRPLWINLNWDKSIILLTLPDLIAHLPGGPAAFLLYSLSYKLQLTTNLLTTPLTTEHHSQQQIRRNPHHTHLLNTHPSLPWRPNSLTLHLTNSLALTSSPVKLTSCFAFLQQLSSQNWTLQTWDTLLWNLAPKLFGSPCPSSNFNSFDRLFNFDLGCLSIVL